ncbi:MAG TPA: hypothetical protein VMT82_03380 [candidate division Zixibacteria bacterium]|nr:hypothetical protein [candidate division Zixibacteria bacterium]
MKAKNSNLGILGSLSLAVASVFSLYLCLNTPEWRLVETVDNVATATGEILGTTGQTVRYSFVVDGKTYESHGALGTQPTGASSSRKTVLVSYDPRDPSINSILSFGEMEDESGEQFRVGWIAIIYGSLLYFVARLWIARRMRCSTATLPKGVAAAAELQYFGALAVAVVLFLTIGLHTPPELSASAAIAVCALLPAMPFIWTIAATHLLRRGTVSGYIACIIGDIAMGGLIVFCGMRGLVGMTLSIALLGGPIALLSSQVRSHALGEVST